MSALDRLPILDLIPALTRLPRQASHQVLPARAAERYITFHYSGVAYADRSHAAEIETILSEASYQLSHNYGISPGEPAYPDGLLYDFVVLSDGSLVRTRPNRAQLWHCGNTTGNAASWSVHVCLGPAQDLTAPQRASLFCLFDALRADGDIPRANVVSHCEWPRGNGLPMPLAIYTVQRNQSVCPGPTLHTHVAAYRASSDDAPTPTPDAPILGSATGSTAQALAWFAPRTRGYTSFDLQVIIGAYATWGTRLGLDWFVALAQCAHETANLTSFWSQRPQRNPAGLGVTGECQDTAPHPTTGWAYNPQRQRWEKGMSFLTWADHAIPAHLGRLLAYALPAGSGTPAQQQAISQACAVRPLPLDLRGSAPGWIGLNGRWAVPGSDYGQRILALAAQMREAR